jgi:anti-anti-sigma factor
MFSFDIKTNEKNIDVTLKGRLDAVAAPDLYKEMEKFEAGNYEKITFHVQELEYIASAGLRVIVFTKQKLGQDVEIFMEGATEVVKSVLEMTGCDSFVTMI